MIFNKKSKKNRILKSAICLILAVYLLIAPITLSIPVITSNGIEKHTVSTLETVKASGSYQSWMNGWSTGNTYNKITSGFNLESDDTSDYENDSLMSYFDDWIADSLQHAISTLIKVTVGSVLQIITDQMGASVDVVVYGKVATGAETNYQFTLGKGNIYGIAASMMYAVLRNFIFMVFAIQFVYIMSSYLLKGTGKGRSDLKGAIYNFIFMFALLYAIPIITDLIIFLRDGLLRKFFQLSNSALGHANVGIIDMILVATTDDPSISAAIICCCVSGAGIYLIFSYIKLAFTQVYLFGTFPIVAFRSFSDKQILNKWVGQFISGLFIPLFDAFGLWLVALIVSTNPISESNYGMIAVFAYMSVVPCRNMLCQLFGMPVPGKGFGLGAAALIAARALGSLAKGSGEKGDTKNDKPSNDKEGNADKPISNENANNSNGTSNTDNSSGLSNNTNGPNTVSSEPDSMNGASQDVDTTGGGTTETADVNAVGDNSVDSVSNDIDDDTSVIADGGDASTYSESIMESPDSTPMQFDEVFNNSNASSNLENDIDTNESITNPSDSPDGMEELSASTDNGISNENVNTNGNIETGADTSADTNIDTPISDNSGMSAREINDWQNADGASPRPLTPEENESGNFIASRTNADGTRSALLSEKGANNVKSDSGVSVNKADGPYGSITESSAKGAKADSMKNGKGDSDISSGATPSGAPSSPQQDAKSRIAQMKEAIQGNETLQGIKGGAQGLARSAGQAGVYRTTPDGKWDYKGDLQAAQRKLSKIGGVAGTAIGAGVGASIMATSGEGNQIISGAVMGGMVGKSAGSTTASAAPTVASKVPGAVSGAKENTQKAVTTTKNMVNATKKGYTAGVEKVRTQKWNSPQNASNKQSFDRHLEKLQSANQPKAQPNVNSVTSHKKQDNQSRGRQARDKAEQARKNYSDDKK